MSELEMNADKYMGKMRVDRRYLGLEPALRQVRQDIGVATG